MPQTFDRARLRHALGLLGEDLASRGRMVEIAVYGGSALMLHFDWRRSTKDVDAIVRAGFAEQDLAASVAAVAGRLGLDPDWLNDSVGMFTPLEEDETLFELSGSYPASGPSGLRVFLATPVYLLALKLGLAAVDRGTRDMDDARALAAHLGLGREADLLDLYASVFGEDPPAAARARFAQVLAG